MASLLGRAPPERLTADESSGNPNHEAFLGPLFVAHPLDQGVTVGQVVRVLVLQLADSGAVNMHGAFPGKVMIIEDPDGDQ